MSRLVASLETGFTVGECCSFALQLPLFQHSAIAGRSANAMHKIVRESTITATEPIASAETRWSPALVSVRLYEDNFFLCNARSFSTFIRKSLMNSSTLSPTLEMLWISHEQIYDVGAVMHSINVTCVIEYVSCMISVNVLVTLVHAENEKDWYNSLFLSPQ